MNRPLTESSLSQDERGAADGSARLGLVVCGWRGEPWRMGEWLLPDLQGGPEGGRVFGRQDPGAAPRLPLWRWRPGGSLATSPVQSTRISASQLAIQPRGGALHLRRLGRRALVVGGASVDEAVVEPGDLVELSGEVLLLVVSRGPEGPAVDPAPHPFGEPDQDGIVGESPAAWALRRALRFVAARHGHVLLRGPSGAGKELAAAAIHRRSARSEGPFVARNAATLPDALIDAELFGHAAGYPNAGMPERPGLIGAAHRGTLFLDELAELPLVAQTHLLRVLDAGEHHRLGESRARRVELRLIGATHQPADALRPDLLARLPLRVELPGLEARREDIPLLALALLRREAARDPAFAERFFEGGPHGWPRLSLALLRQLVLHPYRTHARELLALLWASAARSDGDTLEPLEEAAGATIATPPPDWERWRGEDPERLPAEVLQRALDHCNGVQEEAWRLLGLSSRHQLGRLIRRHGLVVSRRWEG